MPSDILAALLNTGSWPLGTGANQKHFASPQWTQSILWLDKVEIVTSLLCISTLLAEDLDHRQRHHQVLHALCLLGDWRNWETRWWDLSDTVTYVRAFFCPEGCLWERLCLHIVRWQTPDLTLHGNKENNCFLCVPSTLHLSLGFALQRAVIKCKHAAPFYRSALYRIAWHCAAA